VHDAPFLHLPGLITQGKTGKKRAHYTNVRNIIFGVVDLQPGLKISTKVIQLGNFFFGLKPGWVC